jgi:ABC-2 type transport system permease protein
MLAPLLLAGFIALITFMFKANETQTKLSVIDKSGIFSTQLKSDKDIKYTFVPSETEKSLLVALKNVEDMDGVLVIPANTDNNLDILEKNSKLYINKKIGFDAQMKISSQLSEVIKKEKIKKLGLTEGQLSALDQKFMIATENVVDKAKQDDNFAFGVKSVMSMSLMYIIFMFIMIYGVRVMRVLEEKTTVW